MRSVDAPVRLPRPPAELGRLGTALSWLASVQGSWPPQRPAQVRHLSLEAGGGVAAGSAEADTLADSGADLLVVDGPAPTAPVFTALCVLLDVEPVLAVGTAVGPAWAETVVTVRDALRDARQLLGEPERLADDPALGHAVGLLAQSAVRRTPAVLGGSTVVAAAALLAERVAPGARRWWLLASQPSVAVVRLAYAELALEPLLDLDLTAPGATALAADLLVRGIDLV